MDIEEGQFPCINCGADVQVFFSSKSGDRIGWSCPECKSRGLFTRTNGRDQAIVLDA